MSEWIEKEEVLKQIDCWLMTGEYKYSNATHYLDKRISSIKPKEHDWISVKDRLPEKDMPVMTYHEKGFMCIDIWKGNMWAIAWFNDEYTHWMPLPEPPKEDDAE